TTQQGGPGPGRPVDGAVAGQVDTGVDRPPVAPLQTPADLAGRETGLERLGTTHHSLLPTGHALQVHAGMLPCPRRLGSSSSTGPRASGTAGTPPGRSIPWTDASGGRAQDDRSWSS